MAQRMNDFQTIRSEGGLLPADLLRRVLDPKQALMGTSAEDYGLPKGERLNEVITQSWNRLCRHWRDFQEQASQLPEGEAGTGLTNDKWSLPLLRELGFGYLPTTPGPEINGKTYAISRFSGPVPIHLIGCGLDLDRRAAGARGAASINPHGLVQEYLNRSDDHLWAIVANGRRLRILRDNQALSRQSFLEFDLDAMFGGEVFSDFVLLWLLGHATRFTPQDGTRPESCWLEQWTQLAEEQGTRALGELRGGVEQALQILGAGLTGHPRNTHLRERLRSGELAAADLHGQLLRVVYRLIFLFVAEDRLLDGQSLLHPIDDSEIAQSARQRYLEYYSTSRLRQMAGRIKGSRHGDLWQQLHVVVRALAGDEDGASIREALALPGFNGFLWSAQATEALNDAELSNYDLLEVIRKLAFIRQGHVLRPVDYRNLGAEELGGVYESLLALTPQIAGDGAKFTFAEFAGNERKTSGSYYTPDVLVQSLLDSALDPVVDEAIHGKSGAEAEEAILALRVCDPSVGSGHFLVGAARRLARHLARVRALELGESEPSPLVYQQAIRDVIGRCLYGVDINPMSAELCRVGLWLEALEPGKPLSFLDHHIRVGNSLLGATPELLEEGIPDGAFKPIEGDDKKACQVLKKRNKGARSGYGPLFEHYDAENQARLEEAAAALEEIPDDRPEDIKAKERAFRKHEQTEAFKSKKLFADTWCAAFVTEKYFTEPGRESSAVGILQEHLNTLASGGTFDDALKKEIENLATQYGFFHWHLAFPEVFGKGGFDCILGNPPWERVKVQEKEWFAERDSAIANAPNAAARKNMIEELKTSNPELHGRFLADLRQASGESHIMRDSGRYPFCGRGDINLYTVFAESMRSLLHPTGRCGCVLPSGIATDDTTKFFFQDVVELKSLVSLFDFENKGIFFPNVHSSYKFCLFTAGSGGAPIVNKAQFVFFAHAVEELNDPQRRFELAPEDIALLNPNTRTCPIFRSRGDAELTKAIYRRVPVLIREARGDQPEENPWGIKFNTMFHMSNDSHLFRTREQLEADGWTLDGNVFEKDDEKYLPLYEAKMIHHFDHRWATYDDLDSRSVTPDEKRDPGFSVHGRYWVREDDVKDALAGTGWLKEWLLGWRDICRSTDERTVIFANMALNAVGHTCPIMLPKKSIEKAPFLPTNLSSFVQDFAARQKVGGTHLTYGYLHQLPVLHPEIYFNSMRWGDGTKIISDWLMSRLIELTYTAYDLQAFAQDCGFDGPPFRWDEERRFFIRCELDAAFFHLYLESDENGDWKQAENESDEDLQKLKDNFPTPRDAVDYIMETFPIVKRKDEHNYDGDYRTKRVILEIYDEMQEAMKRGRSYQTRLNPPPGDLRCCHETARS